jgi:FKBP-type peptidyl-prolyl cis-trans isomerase
MIVKNPKLKRKKEKKQKKNANTNDTTKEDVAPTTTTTTTSTNDNNNNTESKEEDNDNTTTRPTTTTTETVDNNVNQGKQAQQDNNNNNNNEESTTKPTTSQGGMQSFKNGIQYKDLKVGNGQVIKFGQKLTVYYVGQLDDKSIFDKNITGNGFEFTYGKGEVIKGWDQGLKGMKIGGKRRLIIPSNLGYGEKGTDNIPPNSTLTFTIEVKSAN